ncbi:hypothetical protein HPB50_002775 [Hyalomma asiaticum]|uniref:Uncharacterized protein n=1 Tax=Hyalomma asiaticum TaxID=266040 RepID=A0ACB7S331_HYAAI|nr:hypothetical protein HPB50_002775 [Hyalomma asiaticum]
MPEGEAVIPKDADVAAEWTAVEEVCKNGNGNIGTNVLIARRLHKYYGPLQAVKELSFALKPAECFGLLGVNGAGKTTTFRMLTALTPTTYGEALMKDVVLSEEPRKWQSRLGYCPQGNALLEKLTAYENLYLFGRLRGVPEDMLANTVENIIDITELQEHAAKRCDYYSGGNKRKLSIAVSVIGFPEVVLLDEPYAGVDVLAKTAIYERLNVIKDRTKCSMILTSHSWKTQGRRVEPQWICDELELTKLVFWWQGVVPLSTSRPPRKPTPALLEQRGKGGFSNPAPALHDQRDQDRFRNPAPALLDRSSSGG